jgi:basic membrane lipoprotein Med (substrate-binding protein (PBP1-ABC) superfamily)/DNA-binding SARP family transcriptional activator
MSFRILGALAAETPDGMAIPLGSPKQRALLAILLLHVGEIVSTDQLIELLWGDAAPRTAGHSIQIYVSELRRLLQPVAGPGAIVTRPPGYQLQVPPHKVDARRFEHMVADGARAMKDRDRANGVAILREALRLWRGPALSDFTYEEFAQPYIQRFHDLHLEAIEELASAEITDGRLSAVISLTEAAIQDDPLRERSRELLMLALYRSGRHAEALRTYQKLRELLDEELGLDPSPPLQRLQEQIILHDPSLGPPTTEPAAAEADQRNPYKGLRAFTEDDSEDFFGRSALVDRLEQALEQGARLVALVGPSGSGKSSAVGAGLVPRLRDGWAVTIIGADGAGLDDLAEVTSGPDGSKRRLVVIDQFEELFSTADEPLQRQFLGSLTRAVANDERRQAVLVTLRADFYDRPLLFPAFARVFLPGVVNILPMSAEELEAAIVRPAERSGIAIEPGLLASLIAETVDQPGALPLLQYALTELFDQRKGGSLTLAEYRRLGGLRGVLTRRAEELFATLDANEQRTATQIFLRLVRPGRGTADSRRRLQLSELTALDLDSIALSRVLDTYGRHRLLSFDREESSGAATVEVAHEALLWEWDRLAGWVDRHRTALRRHETFTAALAEWDESGRNEGYLLTGARLDEFASLGRDGALQLTDREREFLHLSERRRTQEAADQASRAADVRRLERRSRNRLVGLIGVVVVLLAGGAWAYNTLGQAPATAALLFHQAGGIDLMTEAGFDRGITDFGLLAIERDASVEDADEALEQLSQEGPDLIFALTLATDVDAAAARHPDIKYVALEQRGPDRDNLKRVGFADEEGAYLAGAVAALKTETGRVGFIGGIDIPVIWRFHAGFVAGVRAVDPDIEILTVYLTAPPNYDGFVSDQLGESAARTMYGDGVDVIFHAAGASGDGVFEAASRLSDETDTQLWVIGVDFDQYETVGGPRGPSWQRHILTSMVKRLDVAVYETMRQFAEGDFSAEAVEYNLASNGIELSYSGGRIDQYRTQIDALRERIINGEITVPCLPEDRVQQAAELGLAADGCVDFARAQ